MKGNWTEARGLILGLVGMGCITGLGSCHADSVSTGIQWIALIALGHSARRVFEKKQDKLALHVFDGEGEKTDPGKRKD